MEVASAEASNGLPPPNPVPVVDSGTVVHHLTDVLRTTLGASKSDLESTGSLLSKAKYSETIQRCTRFASESQTALYAHKDIVEAEETNGTEDGSGRLLIHCLNSIIRKE
jgi:dynein heavy chain 1